MVINIGLDGNFLAFSYFSIFSEYGKIKNPLGTEGEKASYIQGLTDYIFRLVNQLPKGGRLMFCLDSRSWRKDVDREYKVSREDAQGNKGIMDRETKEEFYKVIADFGEVLSKAGICVAKVTGAEGDDILYRWAEYFNAIGENCIIITADKDLAQIVSGPKEPWTVVWNPRSNSNKIFAMDGWLEHITDETSAPTIFDFNISSEGSGLVSFIRNREVQIEYIKPEMYLIKKILTGDDGDDVPSSWTMSKPEGKSIRVTDKRADKILEYAFSKFGISEESALLRWGEEEFMDELAGAILRVMGDVDGKQERVNVRERLKMNAKLMWLHEDHIPTNVMSLIDEDMKESLVVPADRLMWNRRSILEGTKFQHGTMMPRGQDPFSMYAKMPGD